MIASYLCKSKKEMRRNCRIAMKHCTLACTMPPYRCIMYTPCQKTVQEQDIPETCMLSDELRWCTVVLCEAIPIQYLIAVVCTDMYD